MAQVVVNGLEYPIPTLDDLTLGEFAEIERITGQGYDLTQDGALGTLALIYVACKRVDGRVTLDDIKKLGDGDFEIVGVDAEPASVPPPSPGESNDNEPTSDAAS